MKKKLVLVLLLAVALIGCQYLGTIQAKWDKLTPDEKARVVINDLQGQLNGLFDTGKAYVVQKPEHQAMWKQTLVPAFDQTNKALRTVIDLGKTKPLTPEYVYQTVNPRINEIVAYLVKIGAIKQ